MPRKPCYWTRKLELELVKFVRDRDFIWKPAGNTNHQIKQKYKAYAEFAATLGPGFTARCVRDRWVNIRSTFHHNARRVRRADTTGDTYTPCWPLWEPLQFLNGQEHQNYSLHSEFKNQSNIQVKEESLDIDQQHTQNTMDQIEISLDSLPLRQRGERTNRPRRREITVKKKNKCKRVIEDLLKAMKPLTGSKVSKSIDSNCKDSSCNRKASSCNDKYWFFGKHVTEQLNAMRPVDAVGASQHILNVLQEFEGLDGS